MKIINAMFGMKRGGKESVFLDYQHCLSNCGIEMIACVHSKADVIKDLNSPYITINSILWEYDFFAIAKLKKLLAEIKPDCIITHGHRATALFRKTNTKIPIIGIAHTYRIRKLIGLDHVIALTQNLEKVIIEAGQPREKISVMPNMVIFPDKTRYEAPRDFTVPVIGVMSRLVRKKSIDTFVMALVHLKQQNYVFKAIIAGSGKDQHRIEKMISKNGLQDIVEMWGWTSDKELFYKSIDIFCFPSIKEAFGLVLIEAFMYSKPCVVAASEGPLEITNDMHNKLVVPRKDPVTMAEAIAKLIDDKELRNNLSKEGFEKARSHYAHSVVVPKLISILKRVTNLS